VLLLPFGSSSLFTATLLPIGSHFPVFANRELDRGMTELPLNVGGTLALLEQQRSEAVPHAVR